MTISYSNIRKDIQKPLIISLVVFVIGCLAINDLPEYIYGVLSNNWSKTEGTLLARNIEGVEVGSSNVLKMELKYQYVANGQIIFGKRLRFQETSAYSGLAISKLEKKYKAGEKVTVFYDPNNAKNACLEPGGKIMDVVSHFVIYCMLAVIIYFSVYPIIDKTNSNPAINEESEAGIEQKSAKT